MREVSASPSGSVVADFWGTVGAAVVGPPSLVQNSRPPSRTWSRSFGNRYRRGASSRGWRSGSGRRRRRTRCCRPARRPSRGGTRPLPRASGRCTGGLSRRSRAGGRTWRGPRGGRRRWRRGCGSRRTLRRPLKRGSAGAWVRPGARPASRPTPAVRVRFRPLPFLHYRAADRQERTRRARLPRGVGGPWRHHSPSVPTPGNP